MENKFDFGTKEEKIYKNWEEKGYFKPVENKNGKNTGVNKVIVNGEEVENKIKLDNSGKIFNIEIKM